MLWPERKRYELAVTLKGRGWFRARSVLPVLYREATLKELLEFNPEDPGEWAYRFVLERVRPLKKWEHDALWGERNAVFQKLAGTHLAAAQNPGDAPGSWAPFASTLVWMAEALSCPPHELLEEYTLPQFRALAEGLAWNANEQSKEGKSKNAAQAARKRAERTPEQEAEIRRKLSELDKHLKK